MVDLDDLYQTNSLFDEVYNETMDWGTYQPNRFFALKNRGDPIPVYFGLSWLVEPSPGNLLIRHV